ncbi:hypothetical protein JKG47_20035 [Acidithiobacillus sp. MC6.1]|nr:hypothetical protein [Acidithiobacillus sp. MC6.1]
MPKVSISEAARMAGIARSTLYRVYIKPGKISTETDTAGHPVIDVSELMRVFPDLGPVSETVSEEDKINQYATGEKYILLQAEVARLEGLLLAKQEELGRALVEIDWLRKKVDAMEQRLLTGPDTKRRWWWPW